MRNTLEKVFANHGFVRRRVLLGAALVGLLVPRMLLGQNHRDYGPCVIYHGFNYYATRNYELPVDGLPGITVGYNLSTHVISDAEMGEDETGHAMTPSSLDIETTWGGFRYHWFNAHVSIKCYVLRDANGNLVSTGGYESTGWTSGYVRRVSNDDEVCPLEGAPPMDGTSANAGALFSDAGCYSPGDDGDPDGDGGDNYGLYCDIDVTLDLYTGAIIDVAIDWESCVWVAED